MIAEFVISTPLNLIGDGDCMIDFAWTFHRCVRGISGCILS